MSDLKYLKAMENALPFKCVGYKTKYEKVVEDELFHRSENNNNFSDRHVSKEKLVNLQ